MIRGAAALHSGRFETARQAYLEAMALKPQAMAAALGALRSLTLRGHGEARADVIRTIEMLVSGDWESVWTVSQTDSKEHPLKQLTVRGDELSFYDPAGGEIIARQQLEPVYHRNGVAYAITRRCLLEDRNISGRRTGALVLEGHLVSIDTLWDLELAEYVYRRQGRSD